MALLPAQLRGALVAVAVTLAVSGLASLSSETADAASFHPISVASTAARQRHHSGIVVHAAPAWAPTRTLSSEWSRSSGVEFGIYPGGSTGDGSGAPDRLSSEIAAVHELAPTGTPFAVHLYAEYSGPNGGSAASQILQDVEAYAKAGVQVELVLCYRPTDENPAVDLPGFVSWADAAVRQLGPYLSFLQVTNEANVSGSLSDSDGSYPGAESALVDGVIGTAQTAASLHEDISVGFNWAWGVGSADTSFWQALSAAPPAFFSDLGWVGIDIYPGTWGPQLPATMALSPGVNEDMTSALDTMRDVDMPLAGIGSNVPIHVSEAGFPTGPDRSDAEQSAVLQSEVGTVQALQVTDNITGFRWFDLRDANSSSSSDLDQYGLMTDDYSPKPAFYEYQTLIAQNAAGS